MCEPGVEGVGGGGGGGAARPCRNWNGQALCGRGVYGEWISGNARKVEEEKVTMSARNVGEKSGVIVRASRDREKEM